MAEDNGAQTIKGLSIDGVAKKWDWEGLANVPDFVTILSAHTHDNKNVLDGITEQDVTDWDAKQAALSDNDGGYGQRIKKIEDTLAAAINFEAQSY